MPQGLPPFPSRSCCGVLLLWCFFPFWEGSLGASLLYEGDAPRIFAELAQLRIPSVLWMLPSVLQHSQDLPVYSGGPHRDVGSLSKCALSPRGMAVSGHFTATEASFIPSPVPFLLPGNMPPVPVQQRSPAPMPLVLPLSQTHCYHTDTGCRNDVFINFMIARKWR